MPKQSSSNRITVLSTLHQLHAELPGYSFQVLEEQLERLAPDILCLELMPSEVHSHAPRKIKVEYNEVILPFAERLGCQLYGMEPDEPEKTELVSRYNGLHEQVSRKKPEQTSAFSAYNEALYAFLLPYWTSPGRVNSETTDALFEVKHRFQEKIFGPLEQQLWNEWNSFFLQSILAADNEHQGKHIVATVGAEHRYWLRRALEENF